MSTLKRGFRHLHGHGELMQMTSPAEGAQHQRASEREEVGVAYHRALETLKALQAQAKAFAREASEAYELMRQRGPNELTVVNSLPHPDLALIQPILLTLVFVKGTRWRADLRELGLSGHASDPDAAVRSLLKRLANTYLALEREPFSDPEGWLIVQQLVRRLLPRPDMPKAALLQQDGEPPEATTMQAWLDTNAPMGAARGTINAWRAGAYARLEGRSNCRYKGAVYVSSWRSGYSAMGCYLDAGGRITCQSCHQPWSGSRVVE